MVPKVFPSVLDVNWGQEHFLSCELFLGFSSKTKILIIWILKYEYIFYRSSSQLKQETLGSLRLFLLFFFLADL